MRHTLTRGLVEYIHGPESPTSGDELTFFITREVMREFEPRLILVNFWDMDVAHWGSYSLYLQAITRTATGLPECCGKRFRPIPSTKTRRLSWCCPNWGRDGDMNASNGFLNHRSGDPSCRNVWSWLWAPECLPCEIERPIHMLT